MTDYRIVGRLLDLPSDWRERDIFRSTTGWLTFAALCESMLQFAGWLNRAAGVRPGDRVAVCMPRSIAAAQAIYGILAAGAAYVPLQFRGPPARLEVILRSIRPRLILTTTEMAARLSAHGAMEGFPVQTIDADAGPAGIERLCRGVPAMPTIADVGPDDLAVVYFTSGSTGQPKGAMWSHRGVAETVNWVARYRQATIEDRLVGHVGLHYAPALDLFFPLACGCSEFLVMDHEAMFAERVAEIIARERATIWISSATLVRMLLEEGNLEKLDMSALRRIESVGERLMISILRRLMEILPQAQFVNIYGTTEAFDIAHFVVPRPFRGDMTALPIGRPVGNHELSLRTAEGTEVAAGSVGEICISGPAITQGYWEDATLTASKRVNGRPDSYRTGDLAFFGDDGLLHLVGRKDHVIKLRGHRFDLAEIEAALKVHPAVRDAVAFVRPLPQGENEIGAAVLADGSANDIVSELRGLCAERLPSFARPGHIAVMPDFPLLSTGKVDRLALEALIGCSEPERARGCP